MFATKKELLKKINVKFLSQTEWISLETIIFIWTA